jgi:hypothetical protein
LSLLKVTAIVVAVEHELFVLLLLGSGLESCLMEAPGLRHRRRLNGHQSTAGMQFEANGGVNTQGAATKRGGGQ